ncbi:hypothetical protein Dimus_004932, partial [Dionaea muscipula]
MKMATLATYFGLGQQAHRSLADVRMNLEVLKSCATVLFLESSLPEILICNNPTSPNAYSRGRGNGEVSPAEMNLTPTANYQLENQAVSSPTNQIMGEPILSFVESNFPDAESFNMSRLAEQIQSNLLEEAITMDEKPVPESPETFSSALPEGCSSSSGFLALYDVSIPAIRASLIPFYRGNQRIQILHNNMILKLHCTHLKVRFGISTKFVDHAGRPRLSFVVEAPPILCQVLDECDCLAQRLFLQSGSTSDWRPVVTRKNGYWNFPTIRLHIPTLITGDVAKYATEICQKEAASVTEQKLLFSRFDATELDALFTPGTHVDAFISLDSYDYQQNAGVRLVAEKLWERKNAGQRALLSSGTVGASVVGEGRPEERIEEIPNLVGGMADGGDGMDQLTVEKAKGVAQEGSGVALAIQGIGDD